MTGPYPILRTTRDLFARSRWLGAAALAALVLFVFSPAADNGFLSLDDGAYLTQNPRILRYFEGEGASFIRGTLGDLYIPLTAFSLAVDHVVFGDDPVGYHIENILWHLAAVLLAYALFLRLSGRAWISWLAAAFFGLHPLRVESVAWITERKDVLSVFFLVLSWWMYARRLEKMRGIWYGGSWLAFLASVASKPTAIVFPFVLILTDYVARRRTGLRVWLEKGPFFLVSLIFCGMAYAGAKERLEAGLYVSLSATTFLSAGAAFAHYLTLIVWPRGLSCFYPYFDVRTVFGVAGLSALVLFLGAAATAGVLGARRSRWIGFGGSVFLVLLAPHLFQGKAGGFPVFAADRYLYAASLGLGFVLIGLWELLGDDPVGVRRRSRMTAVLACVLVLYASQAYGRCSVWRSDLSLWEDAVKTAGGHPTTHINLANAYLAEGDLDKAREHAQTALFLDPSAWDTRLLLGNVKLAQGDIPGARREYLLIPELAPGIALAYNNLGVLEMLRGPEGRDAAILYFRRALKSDPGMTAARAQLKRWGVAEEGDVS